MIERFFVYIIRNIDYCFIVDSLLYDRYVYIDIITHILLVVLILGFV